MQPQTKPRRWFSLGSHDSDSRGTSPDNRGTSPKFGVGSRESQRQIDPERAARCAASAFPERISTFLAGLPGHISRHSTLCRAIEGRGDHIRNLGTGALSTRRSRLELEHFSGKPAAYDGNCWAGGPLKPGFGLSGAVLLLEGVFLPLFHVLVSSIPTRSPPQNPHSKFRKEREI